MTPDQDSSSGTMGSQQKKREANRQGAILEIDHNSPPIMRRAGPAAGSLDETKEEFPSEEIAHAIKSTSVVSSQQRVHPLRISTEQAVQMDLDEQQEQAFHPQDD